MTKPTGEVRLARPLTVMEPIIREDLSDLKAAVKAAALPYYVQCGTHLIEAKANFSTKHDFFAWALKKFGVKDQQIKAYMQAAQQEGVLDFASLSKAVGDKRTSHEPPWSEHVKREVKEVKQNIPRLREIAADREREHQLKHELGIRLINIGYTVLAKELHPDRKGGSHEAMARLNEVRNILKGAI
jgi:hypothetical protein